MIGVKDKKIFLGIVLTIVLLLFVPVILKQGFFEGVFTYEETYFNLMLINQDFVFVEWFDLFKNNPFHLVLSFISLSDAYLAFIIPLLFGFVSLFLVFLILRKLNVSDNESVLVLLLFALSPIFLFKFSSLNPDNFAFPLLLLSFLLFLYRSYFLLVPFSFLVLVNPVLGIIFSLFFLVNLFFDKHKVLSLVSFIAGSFFVGLSFVFGSFLFKTRPFMIDSLLVEFGSLSGYSIPLLVLSIIGLFSWWERGFDKSMVVVSLFLVFVVSFWVFEIRLLVAFIFAVFAGLGMNYLLNMSWDLKYLKNISLLLIFYIIVFSAIVLINAQLTQINKSEVDAAKFLKSINSSAFVLATEDKGFMIQYSGNKRVFVDGNSFLFDDYVFRKRVVNEVFYARTLKDLESLLVSNNIEYFFISQDMLRGKVWSGREEGLLFFLENSDNFVLLFNNDVVKIYRYFNRGVVE